MVLDIKESKKHLLIFIEIGGKMPYIYAMSDIHGYYDIMEQNLEKINLKDKGNILVFCGDYIDHGSDSCKVLYRIKDLMEQYPDQVVAVKGNHEIMFLNFLEAGYFDIWNINWLAEDKDFKTINTFISEETKNKIEFLKLVDCLDELVFKTANLIKEDIKFKHKDLIHWLKNLPYYYETEKQIFVHAGVDEEAGKWWKITTTEEIFTGKYPASFGYFYKDIIAGHIGTYSLKADKNFHGVYWDGMSHYFIDGSVNISGVIPLLMYDLESNKYIY